MEEADGLLLQNFSRIGWEPEPACVCIRNLSAENIYELCVRFIHASSHDFPVKSFSLPPNVGDRFRCATLIASKIKSLGYRVDIGYQNVLYGGEIETRRLLLFLSSRLPQERSKIDSKSKSPNEELDERLRVELNEKSSESAHWLPWFCKRYNFEWDGRYWRRKDTFCHPFHANNIVIRSPKSVTAQCSDKTILCASVVQSNERIKYNLQQTENESNFAQVLLLQNDKKKSHVPARKPKLPPKPRIYQNVDVNQQKIQHELQAEVVNLESSEPTLSSTEFNLKELEELESQIQQLKSKIVVENQLLLQINYDIEDFQPKLLSMQDQDVSQRKSGDLIPDIDENIEKLKAYLNTTETRSANLMSQWDRHRRVLHDELDALKSAHSQNPYERTRLEISSIESKIGVINKEVEVKSLQLNQLESGASLTEPRSNSGRNFYTKRVLEIVASARKQKSEMDKVLKDIRHIQKESNTLSGRLERTYIATDELMFNSAKKDELIRRAYKHFVSIHETCSAMVSTAERSGHAARELRDLEDKIELEAQHGIDKKLEMLVNNLCEVREENGKLASLLTPSPPAAFGSE